MSRKYTLEERITAFWLKVDKSSNPTDCWLWTGTRTLKGNGYGQFQWHDKVRYTHQLSWELAHNQSVPNGLFVLHECDNPGCVNPAHLRLGTSKDNTQDMLRKKRARGAIGEQNWKCKYPDEKIAEMRQRYASGGIGYLRLAREYGTTKQYMRAILKREVRTQTTYTVPCMMRLPVDATRMPRGIMPTAPDETTAG